MKDKVIQSIPTAVVLALIVFSYFSQQCAGAGHACYGTVIDQIIPTITYPSYFFASYFLLAAIILFFVSRPVYTAWLRLAAWALPLSFFYIATTPVNYMGIGLDLAPFYRDDAARVAGGTFAALSLIYIGLYAFCLKRYGPDGVKAALREYLALTAALVGSLSIVLVEYLGSAGELANLTTFLNVIGLALIATCYSLFITTRAIVEKKREHALLGGRVIVATSLLALNIAVIAYAFVAIYLVGS